MDKKISKKIDVKYMVEDIVGCKWSISVLDILSKGIHRPGAMSREIEGLTPKVLNERLRKLLRYKIIEKRDFDQVPPKVEYHFTEFGTRFLRKINEINQLEDELHER